MSKMKITHITFVMLTIIFCLSFKFALDVNASSTPIGHIYSTDITAYINGMPIESYNINGKTVIIAEELISYGFDVQWNPDNRSLKITTTVMPKSIPSYTPVKYKKSGDIIGDIYETDIYVEVNGMWVESYNIGGRTVIVIEDMASTSEIKRRSRDNNIHIGDGYSIACMRAIWDNTNRTISLECIRPNDKIQTNFGEIKILGEELENFLYNSTYYNVENANGESTYVTRIEVGGYNYFDIESFLNVIGIEYSFHNNIIDISNNSIENKIGIGYRDITDQSCNNILFPLDISIAVDGEVIISPDEYPTAYEYFDKVYVSYELINEAVGKQIYKGKYDLPDECTENIGDILASQVLVYINDMVIPSYVSDKWICYLSVKELPKYGFEINFDNYTCSITSLKTIPEEPPIPYDLLPYTYWSEGYIGSILYPIYNGIYNVTLDDKEVNNVYISSTETFDTPCISIDDLAKIGGYKIDGSNPMIIKIYT